MPHIRELQTRVPDALVDQEKVLQFNEQLRSENDAILATLNIQQAPSSLEETATSNNAITLTSGNHNGVTTKVEDTVIKGMPAGVFMTRQMRFEADAVVDGVHFVTSASNVDELAVVTNGAVVVFRNCIFEKQPTSSTTFVTIDADAKAIFVGCVFKGTPPSGNVIDNGSPPASVQVVASYNKTGNSIGFVTTTGVL